MYYYGGGASCPNPCGGYQQYTPYYGGCGCGSGSGFGSSYAIILVLFILLVIVIGSRTYR